jgi:uncharacterized membrane protein
MNTPTPHIPAFLTTLLLLVPLAILAAVLPLTARSRRGIAFGVTLPLDFADGPEVRAAVTRFRNALLLLFLAAVVVITSLEVSQRFHAAVITGVSAVYVLLLASLLLRAREAARLKPHAIRVPLVRSANLAETSAGTGPLIAAAFSFLPLAATAAWLRAHWSDIPARWPQHWDAAGNVNGWGTRTTAGVYTPLIMGAGSTILLIAILAFMLFVPGADSTLRRRLNAPLAVMTWFVAGVFSVIALLPLLHPDSPWPIVAAIVTQTVAMIATVVWMLFRGNLIGRGASPAAFHEAPAYDGTPDSAWRLGLFYFNPADPAILVPKRFGFGWTLNFGRPIAWLFMAGVVLLLVGTIVIRTAMK